MSVKKACELEIGDTIIIAKGKNFIVDDIDKEFLNNEVSSLYSLYDEPKDEHTKYTFYDADGRCIREKLYDRLFIVKE